LLPTTNKTQDHGEKDRLSHRRSCMRSLAKTLDLSRFRRPYLPWKLWWIPFWISASTSTSSAFPLSKGYSYIQTYSSINRSQTTRQHLPVQVPARSFFSEHTNNDSVAIMTPSLRAAKSTVASGDKEGASPNKKRKTANTKTPKPAVTATATAKDSSPAKKAVKKPAHQVLTERDDLPKLWDAKKAMQNGSYSE
jgi:hypothetical protein